MSTQLSRRRYQKGSLTKDQDRWLGRWREDVLQPDGTLKRVRRSDVIASVKECPTKRLAQRKLDDRLRDVNREDYRPAPAETFGQFAKRWMESVMVHHKPSTQRSERSVVNVHLIPAFGKLAFREINAEMLQTWVTEHAAAPKTIRNIIVTLQTTWATAKAWGYTQADPFEGLRLPTAPKGNTYHFTVEEALAIINAAKGWHRLFFRILAETGMRPGELAGLRLTDVTPRSLTVSQSVWQQTIQTPKTVNALRTFAISAELSGEIQEYINDRKRGGSDADFRNSGDNAGGLLFTSEEGRPLSMDTFRQKILNPILDALGIRAKVKAMGIRCGNYAFRHMNATLMDALNIPLKTRQKRHGHADIATTLTHYSHAVDADDVAAADRIGALLSPKQDKQAVQ